MRNDFFPQIYKHVIHVNSAINHSIVRETKRMQKKSDYNQSIDTLRTERRLSYGHGRRVRIVSRPRQLVVAHTKQIQLGQFAWTIKEEN